MKRKGIPMVPFMSAMMGNEVQVPVISGSAKDGMAYGTKQLNKKKTNRLHIKHRHKIAKRIARARK